MKGVPLLIGGRIDPQTIRENVSQWSKDHQLDPRSPQSRFKNEPRILKLSGNSVVIDLDHSTGEAIVNGKALR